MGRAPCCDKANVKKGPWSPEEDAKLKAYIESKGTGGNWIALPQKIGLKRCGKSCRLRWLNYLRPNIKHGGFTEEEENIICNLYINIGSRWSIIAAQLPGRTDNDIKNYWNTRLKKKLMAKQRKQQQQQAACHILEQEIKRENESYLIDHHHHQQQTTLNQIPPYWIDHHHHQQSSMAIMMQSNHQENHHRDQITRLLMNNYQQFPTTQEQEFYVGTSSDEIIANNVNNFSQWLNNIEYDDVNNNNYNNGMNLHQNEEGFPADIEAYLNGGNNESSTTSNSAGSNNNSWGEMSSLVNTPVSSFDAFQSGILQQSL